MLKKYARKLSIERLFFYISIRLWGRAAVTIKTTFSYTYIYIMYIVYLYINMCTTRDDTRRI